MCWCVGGAGVSTLYANDRGHYSNYAKTHSSEKWERGWEAPEKDHKCKLDQEDERHSDDKGRVPFYA